MKKALLAVTAFCFVVATQAQPAFPFWDDPAIGGCALQSALVKQAAKAREDGVSLHDMLRMSTESAAKLGKEGAWLMDLQRNVLSWVYAHEMITAENVTIDFTRKCLRAAKPEKSKML